MEFLMRIFIAGIVGGVVTAILWVLFFTMVLPWPAHEMFITMVFILGGTASAIGGLKGVLW